MTTDKETREEIAALKREVADLRAAQPKPQPTQAETERAVAEWRDQMHQMRERQMSQAYAWSREELRAFEAASPYTREIAMRDGRAPQNPCSQSGNGAVTDERRAPPNTGGWVEPTPLRPPDGVAYVDMLAIADEVRQRKGNK